MILAVGPMAEVVHYWKGGRKSSRILEILTDRATLDTLNFFPLYTIFLKQYVCVCVLFSVLNVLGKGTATAEALVAARFDLMSFLNLRK